MFPTLRGVLVLLIAAPILMLGIWAPALEWIAWLYVLLALALFALDWRQAGQAVNFEIQRRYEPRLSLGAENPVTLQVRSRLRRPVRLTLRDEPPEAFKLDRQVFSFHLPALGSGSETYHLRPPRRGDFRFGDLNLRWNGPLGLVIRQGKIAAAEQVKVFPNLLDIRRYDLLLRRNRLQEIGLRNSRLFGEGTEFERLREYLPDDEYRRINWKATARRGHPITVEYQTERSQSVIAVMDVGRMMQSPIDQIAKLDYTVNAVLLLTYVATAKGDRVGLMTFADQVTHYLSPAQGRRQFYAILETLYAIESVPVEPDYHRALTYLALKQRRRSLVVIFTDLSAGASLASLVTHARRLARTSLPLVVTISDVDIHAASRATPYDSLTVYQRAAAAQVLEERKMTLEQLKRSGVLTLDVPANQLSLAVINRYLELKEKEKL